MLFDAVWQVVENMWPLLMLAAVLAIAVTVLKARLATPRSRSRARRGSHKGTPEPHDGQPVHQIDAIEAVQFETIPVLNKEEARLLPKLEKLLSQLAPGFRVMAQVSLAEILTPRSTSKTAHDRAFRAINAKRVDFVIFDHSGRVVVAIEYQGTGHYQGRAVVRDAVKREVFRKAGVAFVEATPQTPFEELSKPIEREIRRRIEA